MSKTKWTADHFALVKMIYGMLVGLILIGAGVFFVPHILEDGLTKTEAIFVGVLIGGGLLAALPGIFMQAISKAVGYVRRRNGGGS